jgi:hypothetical protein
MKDAAIAADEPRTPTPNARQSSAPSKPGRAGRANVKMRNAFILMNNSGLAGFGAPRPSLITWDL